MSLLSSIALFPSAKHVVGLDIGSYAIKLVELKKRGKGWALVNLSKIPLSPEVIVEGVIINEAAVIEAINTLLSQTKIKTKNIATSIGGNAVIVKRVALPKMSNKDLERNIEKEAAEHIPFPIEEVSVDYEVIGDDADEPDRMMAYLVAAKRDMINELTGIILSCGLKPAILDVDVFAIGNAFEVAYPEYVEETVGLINIGASVTNINLVQNRSSLFVRDITRGGYEVTEEIQRALGVSFEEAESFKKGNLDDGTDAVIPEEVGAILRSAAGALATDIQRSLDYYFQAGGHEHVDRLLISGGMSLVDGIDRIIEEQTGITVERFDPFRKIRVDAKRFGRDFLQKEASVYAVGVGLAIRRLFDK